MTGKYSGPYFLFFEGILMNFGFTGFVRENLHTYGSVYSSLDSIQAFFARF